MIGEKPQKTVGMIGLGLMGSALADTLLANSFRVTVWNRTRAKAEPLEKAGASVAASVVEAARGTEVLVVCLSDHAATCEAIMTEEVGTALRGKTLVQLSTTKIDEVHELTRWAEANDVAFLKGAILVYPVDIVAGEGAILYGGERRHFEAVYPLLDAMGGRPCFVGERPTDTVAPANAYYGFLYSTLFGFLHGAAICHRSGVSVEFFMREVIEPFVKGRTLMSFLHSAGRAAAKRRYDKPLEAVLDTWNDGLGEIISDIEAIGIDTAYLRPAKALLDRTSAAGHGQKDVAAVVEALMAKKD